VALDGWVALRGRETSRERKRRKARGWLGKTLKRSPSLREGADRSNERHPAIGNHEVVETTGWEHRTNEVPGRGETFERQTNRMRGAWDAVMRGREFSISR
jgi:hypothetical protein